MVYSLFFFYILLIAVKADVSYDVEGYVLYCPCMEIRKYIKKYSNHVTPCKGTATSEGRFGNQADHFLGVLAFSKALNRTLVLPPWIEYRYGEPRSKQIPFNTYFRTDSLAQYHKIITMESFMFNTAHKIWPYSKRISFCYTQRIGEEQNSCNAKSGNPFGPFWDNFDIDFVKSEFYGPLNYDSHDNNMVNRWKQKYPADTWPVLAFTGAPASFPVQKENIHLQKYLNWNDDIINKSKQFIKENMRGGGFLGIHLRNGQDWAKACQHVNDSPMLFAAPQCVGYKNEKGPLTVSMCLPTKTAVIKQVKRAVKKINSIKYVFVASDSNHMIEDLNKALENLEVSVIKFQPSNPHLDLAILGQANHFIGNCVSSYSAFVKRDRDVRGLPSEFWAYPHRKKPKHEDL